MGAAAVFSGERLTNPRGPMAVGTMFVGKVFVGKVVVAPDESCSISVALASGLADPRRLG